MNTIVTTGKMFGMKIDVTKTKVIGITKENNEVNVIK